MDIAKGNINLIELCQKENLSVRSSNVCEWNGLNDLISILNYYWENNDFLGLRNCGQKSNTELIELCKKYEDFAIRPEKTLPENPIEKHIDSLTVRQKKILNNIIESQVSNLSVRSYNAIDKFSGSNFTIRGLKEMILDPRYDIRKIKNIGKKSSDELIQFFKEIREQIEIVQLFDNDDELSVELFNSALRRRFCISSEDIVKLWKGYNFDNGLPIFKTIDILISNGYLFEKKEKEIFLRGFNFWINSESEKLENIGLSLGISRERTRQIRKKILDNIDSRFSFLNTFEFDALNIYGIDIHADIISVDENLIEEIRQKEGVTYNSFFITKIFSILLGKTHKIVGNVESVAFNIEKHKGVKSRWKSIYLVKKEIVESFNFEALINDLKRRISERINEEYSFHFETYLTSFFNESSKFKSGTIVPIAENIVFNEFDITIDLFDNITFKRNTIKQVFEYSYEALEALGEPSKVDAIYKKVRELYPDYNTDENSIRASMQRRNGFVPFGRTSVYGLKIWEEGKNVRGGTIRDITEEYLMAQNEPKHIDDIEKYVNQFRNTTAKNIYSNLQMEVNSRFRFYSGLYIGLKAKQYDDSKFKKLGERNIIVRSWDESFELLSAFANKNKRLPYSSGDEEEQKLYRFMNVQLNKISKGKLDKSKSKKLQLLISSYENKRRRGRKKSSIKTDSLYNELVSFISTNKRLPMANYDEEKNLYHFFYRQRKQYENGGLPPEQQNKYLEITKLIQNVYEN